MISLSFFILRKYFPQELFGKTNQRIKRKIKPDRFLDKPLEKLFSCETLGHPGSEISTYRSQKFVNDRTIFTINTYYRNRQYLIFYSVEILLPGIILHL